MDIGGTTIKSAIYLMNGKLVKKNVSIKTADNLEDFILQMKQLKKENFDNFHGMAICMPGVINSKTGYVAHGGSLQFIQNINLKEELEKQLNCSVGIINDAKSAAIGEQYFGQLQEVENGLSVVLGTGIGLGILIDGKLYNGNTQASGEISFVNANNKPDLSGINGVLLSSVGMIDQYFEKHIDQSVIKSGAYFFEKVTLKDEYAVELIETYCETLAIQLYNLQTLFDPEKIVIGGGISRQNELFEVLDKKISSYGEASYNLIPQPNIEQSKLGNDANLLGALINYKATTKNNSN